MLGRWLATCDIHDEHGRPVHLTPHQWRHTFACRLINRDVPQEVVRVLLDHESHRMTSHYAKITDQTVRRHWEQATKVNIKGETSHPRPRRAARPGPMGQDPLRHRHPDAAQRLLRAARQKTCPHANACLTCPVFLTGPEFLPELREQRHRTLTLIDNATRPGQTRVAEMNQQVVDNLDRMIGELEDGQEPSTRCGLTTPHLSSPPPVAEPADPPTRRRRPAADGRHRHADHLRRRRPRSGGSRSWLYNQPDLRAEIERLRRPPPVDPRDPAAPRPATSLRRLAATALGAATERIRQLESENRELREALARALGERRTADTARQTAATRQERTPAVIGPC